MSERYNDILVEEYANRFINSDDVDDCDLDDFEVKLRARNLITLLRKEILGLENVSEVKTSFKDDILTSLEKIQDLLTQHKEQQSARTQNERIIRNFNLFTDES